MTGWNTEASGRPTLALMRGDDAEVVRLVGDHEVVGVIHPAVECRTASAFEDRDDVLARDGLVRLEGVGDRQHVPAILDEHAVRAFEQLLQPGLDATAELGLEEVAVSPVMTLPVAPAAPGM
jgi:hypothetical protein